MLAGISERFCLPEPENEWLKKGQVLQIGRKFNH